MTHSPDAIDETVRDPITRLSNFPIWLMLASSLLAGASGALFFARWLA